MPLFLQPLDGNSSDKVSLLAAITTIQAQLREANIPLEFGPVQRTGARFPLRSVYVRDPDQNLIEISEPALERRSGDATSAA